MNKYKTYCEVKRNIDNILTSRMSVVTTEYKDMILNSIMTVLRDFIFSELPNEEEKEAATDEPFNHKINRLIAVLYNNNLISDYDVNYINKGRRTDK